MNDRLRRVERHGEQRAALAGLVLAALAVGCNAGAGEDPSSAGVEAGASASTTATLDDGASAAASSSSPGTTDPTTTGATTTDATTTGATTDAPAGPPWVTFSLLASQTDAALGAGQGVELRDGRIYAYGDRQGTGVLREYDIVAGAPPSLAFTGREVLLRRGGVDLVPHPTGLTTNPELGTFLGNTVAGIGTVLVIDWAVMLADGDLDNAVLAEVADDVMAGGTRPEFVRVGEAWRLASAGYLADDAANTLRVFDAAALAGATATSDPGVLVSAAPIGPWVQSLAFFDELGLLVAAQNLTYGTGWRLTVAPITPDGSLGEAQVIEGDLPASELEGIHPLGDGEHAVLITSGATDNLWIAALAPL